MDQARLTSLRRGLLEALVLATISSGKVYVADILERLRAADFETQEGTLYPLLSKMRREKLLDYEWRESTAGPPRKYYGLTATGKEQLDAFRDDLASLSSLISELENDTNHAESD
jgi:PadR family transcriptional regulator PadR